MKAIVLEAEWEPRASYRPLESEIRTKTVRNASQVWKHPRLIVKDIPTPAPGPRDVLLSIKACGICGSDLSLARELEDGYVAYGATVRCPNVLGHELSAVIREVGCEVRDLRVGDAVTACNVIYCGECTPCRSGFFHACQYTGEFGFTSDGGFAEYAIIPAKACWVINGFEEVYGSGPPMYEAGALLEPAGVAFNGLFISGGGFPPGAHVAVHGAGPIGLAAVALARVAGAAVVIAVDVLDSRLTLARQMGADYALNPISLAQQGTTVQEAILELTGRQGADVHVEASGMPERTMPAIEQSLAVGAKVVQIGVAHKPTPIDTVAFLAKAARLSGPWGTASGGIFPRLISLVASGRVDFTTMVTARLDLETAARAMTDPGLRGVGKAMAMVST